MKEKGKRRGKGKDREGRGKGKRRGRGEGSGREEWGWEGGGEAWFTAGTFPELRDGMMRDNLPLLVSWHSRTRVPGTFFLPNLSHGQRTGAVCRG